MNNLNQLKTIALFLTALAFASCDNQDAHQVKSQATIDSLNNQIKLLADAEKQTETNKKLVADFYQELFGDKNADAIDKYIGEVYIQHNPSLPDGKAALKEGVKIWFKDAPKEKVDIHHVGADGDLVYIHTKTKMGAKMASVIDIFRLENGKIVEHWDVIQEVPEKSANQHPMF